jgi:hypothetical protein
MPIELENGLVLLTDTERQEYRAAADLLAEVVGRVIDMQAPMSRGDLVDLIHAYYVAEKDEEVLRQINDLFEAEIRRRRNTH